MLTQRSALALPAALSLVGLAEAHPFAADGYPWWLRCFYPDKIPPGADAIYDVDPATRAFVLGSSEGYQTADHVNQRIKP